MVPSANGENSGFRLRTHGSMLCFYHNFGIAIKSNECRPTLLVSHCWVAVHKKKMFRDTVRHTVGDKLGDKAAEEVPRFCVGDTVRHTVGD